jgi:hypothetical protein
MTKPKAAGVQPRGMVLKGDIVHPELRDGRWGRERVR